MEESNEIEITINDCIDFDNMSIKINKLDNLFTTNKFTPISNIKSSINTITHKIISQIENKSLINDIYIGYINNNNIKGDGLLIKKNNIMIEGTFNGVCHIINSSVVYDDIKLCGIIKNGDFYSGTLIDNNKNIKVVGSFKDGLLDNTVKKYNDNIIYEGECKNGKFNGLGCYTNSDISYEGEWCNNKFDGNGLLITNDYTYNGGFKNGKKHGEGRFEINNQEYFIEYDNDIEIHRLEFSEKKILDLELKITNLENTDKNNVLIIKQQETQIIEYNNKIKNIEKEKKLLEEQFNCKVCYRELPNIVLQPCNHCAICESCELNIRNSQQGRRCPMCRKPYTKHIKIFI